MVSAVQEMTPNNMRGVAVALFGFTNTILGSTTGPLLIASATEHVFKSPAKVGYSIMLVMIPTEAVGCLCFFLGFLAIRAALRTPSELKAMMEVEAHA
jgi:hypothetical protein